MQNKPNFPKAKMNLCHYTTRDYDNELRLRTPGKQTQSNPKTRSEAEIPTGGLLGIHKPGTSQTQFRKSGRSAAIREFSLYITVKLPYTILP